MSSSNKRKAQLAAARELKRVRSINFKKQHMVDPLLDPQGPIAIYLFSQYSEAESESGLESDMPLLSSEDDEDQVGQDRNEKMRWKRNADKSLRGGYGAGSRSSVRNQRERLKDMGKEAKESYNIKELWKRQRDIGILNSSKFSKSI